MSEENELIYGLEYNARALAPQLAESTDVRFFIATQSLSSRNQVHLIDVNYESGALKRKIFTHDLGEVWKLNSSPFDSKMFVMCCSQQTGSQVTMRSSLVKIPDTTESDQSGESKDVQSFDSIEPLETNGSDIKTTEFHHSDPNLLATVIDGRILLHELAESRAIVIAEMGGKNSPKYTNGKWSQHHQGNQFVTVYDCTIRAYDIRDPNHCAWQIDDAHGQLIRDLDLNPNRQCHLVTGGDDGTMKIWDCRNTKDALFVRSDHSHWIWNVRFNTFHDQLILSSSSDCKVLLTCAGSVCSEQSYEETEQKSRLADGVLQTYEHHEDSVYCVEWSSADPWIFASLSYDGRVIVSRVPKEYKYNILL